MLLGWGVEDVFRGTTVILFVLSFKQQHHHNSMEATRIFSEHDGSSSSFIFIDSSTKGGDLVADGGWQQQRISQPVSLNSSNHEA
ncbi:hypothetical protein O6P43_030158 [Quillaja saponaria]|uniref:Uncharacterized protein n=1 Tax=Quillaja saponaria TaxID=32244 RepID=A0AAD7L1X6_QUISA|nr:hypothetical protein O6P43_030158 [Quillaja saponaria]